MSDHTLWEPPRADEPIAPAAEVRDAERRQQAPSDWLPLSKRLNAVLVVLAVVAIFDVVAVACELWELSLLGRVQHNELVTQAELRGSDTRMMLVGAWQFLLVIVAAIVWIRWFRRGYANVGSVAGGVRRHNSRWAIWGWFVPFLSLWRPKQIANDMWRAGGGRASNRSFLLFAWWTFFLLDGFVSRGAVRLVLSDDGIAGLMRADRMYLASDALDAVAAILAAFVAVRITRRLESRRAAGSRGAPVPQPATS